MQINLTISPTTATGHLVPAIYEATAPATVVQSIDYPPPHTDPQDVTFNDVDPGVYIVIVWESTDGTPTGTIRHQFIYDPSYSNAITRDDEFIICGANNLAPNDFPDGATGFSDPSWVGWQVSLERRSAGGTMVDQALSTTDAEIVFRPAGGFDLVDPTNAFVAGEIVVAHFQPQITTGNPISTPTAGVIWSGELDITNDVTLTAANMGQYCLLFGVNPVLNVTLPAANAVPDGKMIGFMSEGGNHLAANIIPAGGDSIKWLNDTFTNGDPLTICQSEELWLFVHNGVWKVGMADGAWRQVGEFVETIGANQQNVLQADGSLQLRAYYPRIWRWANKKLDATMIVTDATWNLRNTTGGSALLNMYPNCGRFSSGTLAGNFRLPLFVQKSDSLVPANVMAGGFRRAVPNAVGAASVLSRDKVGNFGASIQGRIIAKSGTNNQVTVLSAGPSDVDKGPNNVTLPFKGSDVNTGLANNETTPFYTTTYLFIRF